MQEGEVAGAAGSSGYSSSEARSPATAQTAASLSLSLAGLGLVLHCADLYRTRLLVWRASGKLEWRATELAASLQFRGLQYWRPGKMLQVTNSFSLQCSLQYNDSLVGGQFSLSPVRIHLSTSLVQVGNQAIKVSQSLCLSLGGGGSS